MWSFLRQIVATMPVDTLMGRHQYCSKRVRSNTIRPIGTWGHKWTGSHIILRCDNMAIINSKKCADKLLAHLLRCCHYLGAQFDFMVTAEHIQGKLNTAADALSRNLVALHLGSERIDNGMLWVELEMFLSGHVSHSALMYTSFISPFHRPTSSRV